MDRSKRAAGLYAAGSGRGAAWVLPIGSLFAFAASAYYVRSALRSELGGPLGHLVSSPAEARVVSFFAALVLVAGFVALIVEYLVSRKRLPLLRLVTWRTHVFVIRAFLLPLPYRIRDVAAFELRGPSSRPVETMVEQFELSTLEMVIGHRIVKIHTRNEFQRVDVERFSTQVREANETKTGA